MPRRRLGVLRRSLLHRTRDRASRRAACGGGAQTTTNPVAPTGSVNNGAPYGDGAWRLYDLSIDPGETNDLAAREPALFDEMMRAYETYAEENGVLEMPEGYVPLLEMMKSTGGE